VVAPNTKSDRKMTAEKSFSAETRHTSPDSSLVQDSKERRGTDSASVPAIITNGGETLPSHKATQKQIRSVEEDKSGKEETVEAPFELVQSKKKKAKKTLTQREAGS
jgi:hypothetical protein